ncbi:MAG: hypothetical protein JNL12_08415, partial [Planctomycetes bacterium]|nr:hypothetical protein [Planctomycetota bacterium]
MLRRLACSLLPLLPTAALAQNGPPTFVVRDDAVVIMHLDDVPGLLASLEATSLGRLLA